MARGQPSREQRGPDPQRRCAGAVKQAKCGFLWVLATTYQAVRATRSRNVSDSKALICQTKRFPSNVLLRLLKQTDRPSMSFPFITRRLQMAKTPAKLPSKPLGAPPARISRATTLYTHPSSQKAAVKSAAPKRPAPMPPSPITSPKIKHLAGVGAAGGPLTQHQVRELAASVLAHIEPRKKPTH